MTAMILRTTLSTSRRCFSSSAQRSNLFISNVGKQPVVYTPAVTFKQTPTEFIVTGPLGTTSVALDPFVQLSFPEPNTLWVRVEDSQIRKQRQMWGTTRTLIQNAIEGMTNGFSVPLYLVGVGYRAALETDPRGQSDGGTGERLNLKLGQSHSVLIPIPPHIKASVPTPTKIVLECTDKQRLGQFAASIREHRKPEPYKGKVSQ